MTMTLHERFLLLERTLGLCISKQSLETRAQEDAVDV